MPPETWDSYSRLVLESLRENRTEHQEIFALLNEVRASQVKLEVNAAKQHPAPPWWRGFVLSLGGAILVGFLSWGGLALLDHEARIAVLEIVKASP